MHKRSIDLNNYREKKLYIFINVYTINKSIYSYLHICIQSFYHNILYKLKTDFRIYPFSSLLGRSSLFQWLLHLLELSIFLNNVHLTNLFSETSSLHLNL